MSKRKVNSLLGTLALAMGGCIYILFRDRSYIAMLFEGWPLISCIRSIIAPYAGNYVKYYLGDFLWCFSLGCYFQAVFLPKNMGVFLCAGAAFLCGTAWELMQYIQFISGTADVLDILMYLSAGILCTIINLKERKL